MKANIFLFHRVSPQRDKLWDPLSPERFDEILKYLKSKFEIHQIETLLANTSLTRSKKPLASIVFDDGYKDYIEYALPILKKHNLSASMYLVTDCVESGIPPWTYVLDNAIVSTKKNKIEVDNSLFPEKLKYTAWKNETEKIAFAKKLKPFLKTVSNGTREKIYKQVIKSLDDVHSPEKLMMNWKEINEIKTAGTIIGSHTAKHPLLAKIETESEIENELKSSAEKIKEHIGEFPLTISYPIGNFDELVKNSAKKTGYKFGLAVEQKIYDSTKHDLFAVPRIELYNEPMLKTKLRINGTLEKIKNVLR
ncbi:MAG: polysaccharide deacetylase family protein [Bacteroidia bacterium]